ncbi:acyl-CoA thioesterase [Dyella mobilis]|uniref:Thioesterase family protein n=1 Tax=Dyella mobilis TaxID=1849582 RepID=A0ABS2KGY4_9GAMM|nr:thioesterase family protein [Dyella mobilis]MBM7130432.1 thioesterase family protein [Dyella mobilis]GLQ97059.1 acyl-CoA thioesterase [Dyella mobilis]
MRFSEVLNSLRHDGDTWIATISEDWLQGRSTFGGLQAALALRAMRELVPEDLPLRSLQVAFIAPIAEGTVRVAARVLRRGKSVMQIEARLLDGDDTACLVIGVFGAARTSTLRVLPAQPQVEAMAEPHVLRYVPGVLPQFTQHFDACWLQGDIPFSGSKKTEQVVVVGLKDEGVADEAQVVAFADFIPPLALSMLDRPTPGSSLTWMLECFADSRGLPLQNWRIDAQMQAAQDGYTSQQVMLWGPGGEAVALSRQSMVVFG